MYDFIIAGGGPSGSTISTYLSRKGFKCLIIEKEKFPRQHVGESLLPFCYYVFEELGVVDKLNKRFVRKPGVTFTNHDGSSFNTYCFDKVIKDDSALSYHVIRAEFDKVLLDNSRENGVEVWEETKVKKVDFVSENEVHVTIRKDNEDDTVSGKFFVDATGQDTFLSQRLKLKKPFEGLNRASFTSHWEGCNYVKGLNEGLISIVYLGGEKSGWIGMQPVGKDRVSIGLVLNNDYIAKRRKEITSSGIKDWVNEFYTSELKTSSYVVDVLGEQASMIQEIIVVSNFSYYSDKKYDDNWVMVGDSGAFIDPIFASGVYLGMTSAKLISEALEIRLKDGLEAGNKALKHTFEDIHGAYDLVYKFIKLFYDPDSFNFSGGIKNDDAKYQTSETAFALLHFLLAGDFFKNYKRYTEFLDVLDNPKQLARYKNLVMDRDDHSQLSCNKSENVAFGEIGKKFEKT